MEKIPLKYQEDIRKASNFLKNEGCESIFLFGSIVTGRAHEKSDIDLGIKGLPPEKFFSIYSKLYMNLSNDFHLVDFDFESDFFSLLKRQNEVMEIG